jgi:predicted amidohydrolase YtcJ
VAQAARAVPPNTWVLGWGWDQESWRDSGPIRLVDLQSASGNRPVLLFHATDDAIIANVAALASAGVPEDLPDPPGGRVGRDLRGVRIGTLMGEASSLVLRALAVPSAASFGHWYAAAAESCLTRGVTLAHDGTVPVAARGALAALWANEKTRPALGLSVSLKPEPLEFDPVVSAPPGPADRVGGLSIEGVTFRLDGFVNTRGAALSHIYYDSPGNRGFIRYSPAEVVPLADGVMQAGWRPLFEAHGDSALSIALGTLAERGPSDKDPRPLVSGLELVRPDQFAPLAASGAGLIVTPTPMIDGWHWMENRIGPDAVERPWALAELGKGSPLALGTGAPFADGRPILAFYAAITRQNLDGRPPAGGWKGEERISREQALRALTLGGAYAPRPLFRHRESRRRQASRPRRTLRRPHDRSGARNSGAPRGDDRGRRPHRPRSGAGRAELTLPTTLVLFEDHAWRDLYPLTLVRPSFDLRVGVTTLGRRLAAQMAARKIPRTAFVCRPWLAPQVERAFPGAAVNELTGGDDLLFVNGATLFFKGSSSGSCVSSTTSRPSRVREGWWRPASGPRTARNWWRRLPSRMALAGMSASRCTAHPSCGPRGLPKPKPVPPTRPAPAFAPLPRRL